MTLSDTEQRLAPFMGSDDLLYEMQDFVEELEKGEVTADMMEPLLRFIEAHDEEDLGIPCPFVYIVERFYHHGYEEELLRSLQRQPTIYTLSMLNRLVNGTDDAGERNRYFEVFRKALAHSEADEGVRAYAADKLEYYGKAAS